MKQEITLKKDGFIGIFDNVFEEGYIDALIEQQHKTLEQSDNISAINRSQGSIMAFKRLKLLRDEVLKND